MVCEAAVVLFSVFDELRSCVVPAIAGGCLHIYYAIVLARLEQLDSLDSFHPWPCFPFHRFTASNRPTAALS